MYVLDSAFQDFYVSVHSDIRRPVCRANPKGCRRAYSPKIPSASVCCQRIIYGFHLIFYAFSVNFYEVVDDIIST